MAAKAEPGTKPARQNSGKTASGTRAPVKKGSAPDFRKFIADTLIRADEEHVSVTKDALYQAFARWCREHRVTPVPDRKTLTVALKNKFAFTENLVDGESSWVNIRLK